MASTELLLTVLTLVTALGSALVAGVFLAFSNFVMRALERIEPAAGIAAMQAINVTVLNPGFLGLFMGTAVLSAAVAALGVWRWPAAGSALLAAGGALYLIGTFGVTIAFNVPRNDELARLDASAAGSLAPWQRYVAVWTRWNHVRTVAAVAASLSLMVAALLS